VTLFERLDHLVDGWCGRRALGPLRCILQGYPLLSGLSDEWHQLRAALRDVRALGRDVLTPEERESVDQALREVERTLRENGWPLRG